MQLRGAAQSVSTSKKSGPTLRWMKLPPGSFRLTNARSWGALSVRRDTSAFFACWTRKEAYLKARGVGLSLPLNQFDVSFLPHEEPRLLETRPDPAEANRWQFAALDLSSDYAGALAAAGTWQLKCWDLDLGMLMNKA